MLNSAHTRWHQSTTLNVSSDVMTRVEFTPGQEEKTSGQCIQYRVCPGLPSAYGDGGPTRPPKGETTHSTSVFLTALSHEHSGTRPLRYCPPTQFFSLQDSLPLVDFLSDGELGPELVVHTTASSTRTLPSHCPTRSLSGSIPVTGSCIHIQRRHLALAETSYYDSLCD